MPPNALKNHQLQKRSQRLALLIHGLRGGGAERVMSQLAARWSSENEIHVITWSAVVEDEYPMPSVVRRHALELQSASAGLVPGLIANWQRVRRLRACLRDIQPDRILSFCDQMNIVALEAGRGLPNVPIWIAEHSDPQHQQLSPVWEAWRRRSYPRASVAVALTQPIAEYMRQWVPAERLRVIPTAIADKEGSASYCAQGQPLNTLLFVGRLSQEKNLSLLLNAWRLIQGQLLDWRLVIVGDGEQRQELQHQASGLSRVEFLGWQRSPEQFFRQSQLFVLTSVYEGFPVALLESLSYGVPAITTDCSTALQELQSQSQTEFLRVMRSGQPEELAQAIERWASDPASRQTASVAAVNVAALYGWKTVGPKWDEFLKH